MKISVALCTYNGEQFLEQQLDSILNQTIPVQEIVITDDLSTDKTVSILEKYKALYPKQISFIINESNLKSNKNFEKAFTLTTGDYIFFADQDDIWKSNKVEKIIKIFEKYPDAEGVFSNADFIDDKNNSILQNYTMWDLTSFFETEKIDYNNIWKLLTHKGNFVTGATLCVKKETKNYILPFITGDNFIHDEWIAYILAKKNKLVYSTENLIHYRLHSKQQLGIGTAQNLKKITSKNKILYKSIVSNVSPKRFSSLKITTRAYYFQYEKFKNLFKKYQIDDFLELSDMLKEKFIDEDIKMKKSNPILYYFRKRKDNKKGKRKL